MVAKELRIIMAQLGLRTVNEMIGRVDLLQTDKALAHWKAKGLDLSAIIAPAQQPDEFLGSYAIHDQDHELDKALDNKLIPLAEPALTRGEKVHAQLPIVNTNRVVGAMLSNKVITDVGPEMLPDDTIHFKKLVTSLERAISPTFTGKARILALLKELMNKLTRRVIRSSITWDSTSEAPSHGNASAPCLRWSLDLPGQKLRLSSYDVRQRSK